MEMNFRWYGQDDYVILQQIRIIPGMQEGIVTAVYDIPEGEVWSTERIEKLKKDVEDAGLNISVIESVPVHEEIKQGKPNRDQLIENYKTTITNLGKADIPVVCYNFMPVFDWTRSDLNYGLPDGSKSLAFIKEDVERMDPAECGLLMNFVGMLTDSRSFISYTRHEQFRCLFCDYIGDLVERGEIPNNEALLEKLITNVSYNNAVAYFDAADVVSK